MRQQILVVDDFRQNLDALEILLTRNGYTVATASNGVEALGLARRSPPDLIVSDIMMPVMDGFALCRQCKAEASLKPVPFVFYTATYNEPNAKELALGLGAVRFILKPQEPEVFVQILREVLETPRTVGGVVPEAPLGLEMEFFRQHNKLLFRKLEKKMRELKETNQTLERDIAERQRAEERLQKSQEQLRALSVRLQSLREEERTRIAREIHDELGQSLTGLKMDLTWLGKRVQHEAAWSAKIAAMLKLTDHLIETGQRISSDLRPGLLDDLGLWPALEWQVEQFQDRMGIQCVLTLPHQEVNLPRSLATALFRVFQEMLTNAARHARATRVEVQLRTDATELWLEVKDNGRGITEKEIASPSALGLLGMRERILPFGGAIQFTSAPGQGTAVVAKVPLEQASKDQAIGHDR